MGDPVRAAIAQRGKRLTDGPPISDIKSPADQTTDSTNASTEISVTTREESYPMASLPGLPPEKLHDILAHLPAMDIVRFSMVSKQHHTIVADFLRYMPADGRSARRKADYRTYTSTILDIACQTLKLKRKAARLELLPWQPQAKDKMAARLAQLTEKAVMLTAGVGGRFHDVTFTLDQHYAVEVATALIQSDGWSHLELRLDEWANFESFLWDLVAHAHAHPQARMLSIACTYQHAFPEPHPALQILAKELPGQLQISALRVPGCPYIAFQGAIDTSSATLEELEIALPSEAKVTNDLLAQLALYPRLRELGLNYIAFPAAKKFLPALIKKINSMKIEAFSLAALLHERVHACLTGLVADGRRQLKLQNLFFMPGSLAGFGEAIASGDLQSLAFSDCGFFDVTEFEAFLAGVAGSKSLTRLSVLDCDLRGATLDQRLIVAAGKCTSLQYFEISAYQAKRQADALVALRIARPDLQVEIVAAVEDGSDSEGSADSDSEDRNFRLDDAMAFAQFHMGAEEHGGDNGSDNED
jgi:hypothetical protein